MDACVDLRSDTVTRPTAGMRRAMAEARVGDDVLDGDPTACRLQEHVAALLGKEAGLLVPTGTMSNAIALKVHTRPGDEVLMDQDAHSLHYEVGMPATIAQVMTRQFRSHQGVPDPREIAACIRAETLHTPGTALIVLENTHNRAGGAVTPLEIHRAVYEIAQGRDVRVHLDGARLFHAAIATGRTVAEYAQYADSVTIALSKGLGCPAGSVLCGTRAFIERARRVRKMLGGAMRQVGILAAAGLYALQHHVGRLHEDHANAMRLAEGIREIPGIVLQMPEIPTNMVYFQIPVDAGMFARRLAEEHGVLCLPVGAQQIRMVTHLDVDAAGIARAVEGVGRVMEQFRRA
ncbi:MAG: GntG family PLP-dependent aldolase [Chloroherpetonaceae bacterium]|nr:aminotransferase class I/II-fold pyridoxal phosphate-dependent enzyme [Chthonomonadaceae bacterium]MDW8207070.1 GntG family PLP-dependent aldolase [Chloroherpetonaceae bacterium]